jgi:hypothetical protein
MSYGQPEHTDVMVIAEIQELLARELGAVVRDDAVRNPKVIDDVGEEQHGLLRPDASDRSGLDPLGNLSTTTSKWVKPLVVLFRGPTKSSPQTANGQVIGMICKA